MGGPSSALRCPEPTTFTGGDYALWIRVRRCTPEPAQVSTLTPAADLTTNAPTPTTIPAVLPMEVSELRARLGRKTPILVM